MSRFSVEPNYKKRQQCPVLTVGTGATSLPTLDTDVMAAPEKIYVEADPSNTEVIWIGDTTTTSDGLNGGFPIAPGYGRYLPGHVISQWRAICASGGQKLYVHYYAGVY